MATIIRAASPILIVTLITILLIAGLLIVGGIVLVYLGAAGNTEITLFGNTFKSEVVGAVGIFVGGVFAALGIQRTMRTLERLGALPAGGNYTPGPDGQVPQ
jgi:hypothetical protein